MRKRDDGDVGKAGALAARSAGQQEPVVTGRPPLFRLEAVPLAEAWGSRGQTADLLAGRPELQALYHRPLSAEALPAALADRQGQEAAADPAALAAALAAGQARYGATAAQRQALADLAAGAWVVVTGQQPGWLGGPLYTLYKAVSAVVEAERLRAAGHPAVAVFWVAAEDDDLAEVATAWVVDSGDQPVRLTLPLAHRAGESVGSLPVTPAVLDEALAAVAAALPPSPARAAALDLVAEAWTGQTLADGFARLLTRLLGDWGLLLLDPTEPAVRALSRPFFERLLADPLAATRLAGERGQRLAELGYKPPVHRQADLAPFYRYRAGRRQRLRWQGDRFVTDEGEALSREALADELAADPGSVSAGLLVRPVLQDYLCRTAIFLVGPGELAYLAQVQPLYDLLGVAPPVVMPRRSATLVPPAVDRGLRAYGLSPLALSDGVDRVAAAVSRRVHGAATSARFASARAELGPLFDALASDAAAVDPTLARTGEGTRRRVLAAIDRLEAKVHRAQRRQDEVLGRRLARAAAWLVPGGAAQERRLTVVNGLALAGEGFASGVVTALRQVGWEQHAILRFEE